MKFRNKRTGVIVDVEGFNGSEDWEAVEADPPGKKKQPKAKKTEE